jgi:hypothetical protein
MLTSPYLYVYDSLILLPAFVYAIQRGAPLYVVALAWLLPIATMIQVASGAWPVNIAPLTAIILLGLAWRAAREEDDLVGN